MLLGSRRRHSATSAGQVLALFALLVLYGGLVFASVLWFPEAQMVPAQAYSGQPAISPTWQNAATFGGGVFLAYGLLGLAGLWLAGRFNLPGVYREGAGPGVWLLQPMMVGLVLGVFLVVADTLFSTLEGWTGFSHPVFPFSIVASASAGLGEEILFRLFMLGFWAFLLNRLLGRSVVQGVSLWLGNLIAALAFTASHLPAAMILLGAASPAEIPPVMLAELLVLNGTMGLIAGQRYIRDGLIAAVGVHFWADIVWHVVWPLVGLTG